MADAIGYPVMLKAAGGWRRHRHGRVAARRRAGRRMRHRRAAGAGRLRLRRALSSERYLDAARHVEVQVFGDAQAAIVHLHERECSIQRRHQKLIEESPRPRSSPACRPSSWRPRWRARAAVGYVNAGTMEFIVRGRGASISSR